MKRSLLGMLVFSVVGLGIVAGYSNADDPTPPGGGPTPFQGASTPAYRPAIPPTPAVGPGTAAIQWEYTIFVTKGEATAADFDKLGQQGWEMCGVRQIGQSVSYFYFKREKLSDKKAGVVSSPLEPARAPNIGQNFNQKKAIEGVEMTPGIAPGSPPAIAPDSGAKGF